jgi:5-methylcytosine-specific restriction endonuclease McrA
MTPLIKQIIAFRKKGLSFNQIAKQLKCSKSTVSYALRKKTRDIAKQKENDKPLHERRLSKKVFRFKNPKPPIKNKPAWYLSNSPRQISKSISTKASTFQRTMTFNYKDVHEKYGDHFPCALTGRPLEFNEPQTYEYDHILPTSRGGDNSIDNLQLLCPEANKAKGMMTDDEFKDLCREVIIHAGYKIYKPIDK